jgi:hypothetical protein
MDDDEHARACVTCNQGRWQDYRAAHPGPVRRFLAWLADKVTEISGGGFPLPPEA